MKDEVQRHLDTNNIEPLVKENRLSEKELSRDALDVADKTLNDQSTTRFDNSVKSIGENPIAMKLTNRRKPLSYTGHDTGHDTGIIHIVGVCCCKLVIP